MTDEEILYELSMITASLTAQQTLIDNAVQRLDNIKRDILKRHETDRVVIRDEPLLD